MQKELQEQFEKGLENEKLISVLKKASDFDETQYKIIVKVLKDYTFSFIDQNFIGKEAMKKEINDWVGTLTGYMTQMSSKKNYDRGNLAKELGDKLLELLK